MAILAIHKVTELPESIPPNSLFLIRKGGFLNIACSDNPEEGEPVSVAGLDIGEHYISLAGQESKIWNAKTIHVKCYATNGKLSGRTSLVVYEQQIINLVCNGYKLSVDSITPNESNPTVNDIVFSTDDETLNNEYVMVTIFTGGYSRD